MQFLMIRGLLNKSEDFLLVKKSIICDMDMVQLQYQFCCSYEMKMKERNVYVNLGLGIEIPRSCIAELSTLT